MSSSRYLVFNDKGVQLLITEDLLAAMTLLKKQPAGSKVVRDDGAVLAYNSSYRPPSNHGQ